jgi:UDP-N-acetylmuramyl pentapeptide phosphotransferase/UDP-N-acetylglucosamine-1-phosphate transferase
MTLDSLWAGLLAFGLTVGGTRLALGWLRRRQILDHPNDRSSHSAPVPRGGGLAVVTALAAVWWLISRGPGSSFLDALTLGAVGLMAVSWLDDRRGLPPLPRLALHAAAVTIGLVALPTQALVFHGGLPLWADRGLAGLGWLWFVNLFNFMDGIDGITGTETASVGLGIGVVATLAGLGAGWGALGASAAGVGLGFLVWNWHPAKIFLGDCGSVPLGFALGGLLIALATAGQLAAALILPAYYVADATITLVWRLIDGERVWQAHRRHFYQRALRGAGRHDRVVIAVALGNLGLIGCAAGAASGWPVAGSLAAALVVVALLTRLQLWSREGV